MLTSLMLYFIIPLGLTIGGYLLTHNKTIAIGVFIVTYAITLVAIDTYNRQESAKETEGHGFLIPANDPSPENPCLKLEKQYPPDIPIPKIPSTAIFFYVGSAVLYWLPDSPNRTEIITIKGTPVLAINRTSQGFTIDADLFNSTGDLMARIRNNKFNVVSPETSYSDRPDPSTLTVYNKKGDEALYIRFMNPTTVRIRGTFPTSDGPPIIITDTTISRGIEISGNCSKVLHTYLGFD